MTHFNDITAGNSEEVQTEDNKYRYWREALPLPWIEKGFLSTGYRCECMKYFTSMAGYELHWRKAYMEESKRKDKA